MSIQNLTGQTLGQYELRELLGMGGMGAVYRAYQSNLKRQVAVKVLSELVSEQPNAIERFNREAEASAALEHAHIVRIYDYGTQRGINYLVMQLLTGGTLAQRFKQRAGSQHPVPSLGEIGSLLEQLGSALDYAHAQGVIHRDIKPSNVMFDNQGNAYIVDFGIARLVQATSGLTGTGQAVGTWGYMAPEQWRAEDPAPTTDQYALGVMTYALVTGNMPFEASTPPGMMHKHLNEMPTPAHVIRPDVPEAVTLVLERAMAKQPEDRFPTTTAFAQAFNQAVQGNPGQATAYFTSPLRPKVPLGEAATPRVAASAGTSQPATAPIYRNPIVWGLVAVIAVLVVGLVYVLSGNGEQEKSSGAAYTETAPAGIDSTATATMTPEAPGIVIVSSDTPAPPADTPPATETPPPTATAAGTDTPSPTSTPAPTETFTPSPEPTLIETEPAEVIPPTETPSDSAASDPVQAAIEAARTFSGGNSAWTPVIQVFDGVEMVLVPAGCFTMGSDDHDPDERPEHRVCFDQPFWIDRLEVTSDQYGSPGTITGGDRPRESVTWSEALEFCESRGARLPTEAEWEYAARGPDGWFYPWGNQFITTNAVWNQPQEWATDPAGSLPAGASWVGALDMSGNVWEWVADWYNRTYYATLQDGVINPTGPETGETRTVRGGSWSQDTGIALRTTNRGNLDPELSNTSQGFRCARPVID